MTLKKLKIFALISATFFLSLQSKAADTLPVATQPKPIVAEKHLIKDGIQLMITPRGAKYFETRMGQILGNLGISVDEGYFPASTWESSVSYDLDNLNLPKDAKDLVVTLRNVLNEWFVGFPLKDIRPAVEIGDSLYLAQFNRFALVTDEPLMKALGKTDGAVLAIELEIKELTYGMSRVRAYDKNTPQLGQVGFDDVSIKVAGGKTPLKIRLPFYVRMNENNELQFEAVKIEENVKNIDLDLRYKKLITPTIQLVINGQVMEFNQKRLETELAQNLPQILIQLRGAISDFATKQLPEYLNTKAKEVLVGSIEEVNKMDPPGADPADPGAANQHLLWGLQLQKINLQESLKISLNAYFEDPQNPHSPLATGASARSAPSLNALPVSNYDMAMVVDRGVINRTLQLSYQRGIFSKIPIDTDEQSKSPKAGQCLPNGGKPQPSFACDMDSANCKTAAASKGDQLILKLIEAPVVDAVPAGKYPAAQGETFFNIHGRLKVFGMESVSIALKDGFEVSADLVAKVRKVPYGGSGLQIVLWDVNPDSISLNKDYLTFLGKLFSGIVEKSMRKQVAELTAQWRCLEEALPGTIALPPDILNIKLDINHLVMEPQGQLTLYLNYADTNGGNGQ